jgi:hypothetical protein
MRLVRARVVMVGARIDRGAEVRLGGSYQEPIPPIEPGAHEPPPREPATERIIRPDGGDERSGDGDDG